MPSKLDKLFALKAVEKKVTDERKLLEYECRDELLAAYEADGTDRRTSPFFGPEAGKYSVKRFKAKPPIVNVEYGMADDEEFAEWLEANQGSAISYVKAHAVEFAQSHFDATGELPDGFTRVEYEEPGEPERVTAQVYSFKPDIVLEKLAEHGNVLEGANRLLLGDGDD